ncbi:MAG: hypothetical protein AAFX85_18285 [Pseudomonadota bacterium]
MQELVSTITATWVVAFAAGLLGTDVLADDTRHDELPDRATQLLEHDSPWQLDPSHHRDSHHDPHHGSHLSVLAGTTIHGGDAARTYGLDYEFRFDDLLGIGAVAEHAVAPVEATTFLAVADLHVWRELAVQTGPGAELLHDPHGTSASTQVRFVYRVGMLYEFALGGTTISPQLHYDMVPGGVDNSVVAALAFGRGF